MKDFEEKIFKKGVEQQLGIMKASGELDEYIEKAKNKTEFSEKEREKLSKEKEAMPDGSFPIRNKQDLKDAVKQWGRAKDPEAAKRWIIKRARQLKLVEVLPEKWGIKKALKIVNKAVKAGKLDKKVLG